MKKLQLSEPLLWVRPAHDGLKVIPGFLNDKQEEEESNLVKNNKISNNINNNGIINDNNVINSINN